MSLNIRRNSLTDKEVIEVRKALSALYKAAEDLRHHSIGDEFLFNRARAIETAINQHGALIEYKLI